jgi:hypothetical protein
MLAAIRRASLRDAWSLLVIDVMSSPQVDFHLHYCASDRVSVASLCRLQISGSYQFLDHLIAVGKSNHFAHVVSRPFIQRSVQYWCQT